MNCLKCGRKMAPGLVFCEECQTEMEKYPVDPETPVILPNRAHAAPPKRARIRRPEEVSATLRRWIRFLVALCSILTISLTVTILMLLNPPEPPQESTPDPGQNYSTGSIGSSSTAPATQSSTSTAPTDSSTSEPSESTDPTTP